VFAEPPEIESPAPDAVRQRIWRSRDILLGLGLVVGAFVLVLIGLGVYVGVTGDEDSDTPGIVSTLCFELLIGASVLFLAARRGKSFRDLGFRRPRHWGPLAVVWGGAYGVLIAYQIVLALLKAAGVDTDRLSEGNPLPVGPGEQLALLVILGVAVVAVAPLSEELFFRALVFRGLRGYWRLLPSLAVSGTLFAAFHGNISVFVPFAFIGALFAWGYEESDSLWVPIIAHALVNGVSFALSVAGVGD
jgi:membrane protease YdiL (CAAX protease family)